jgi:hypothetical protein
VGGGGLLNGHGEDSPGGTVGVLYGYSTGTQRPALAGRGRGLSPQDTLVLEWLMDGAVRLLNATGTPRVLHGGSDLRGRVEAEPLGPQEALQPIPARRDPTSARAVPAYSERRWHGVRKAMIRTQTPENPN